jgi:hypothetical protein
MIPRIMKRFHSLLGYSSLKEIAARVHLGTSKTASTKLDKHIPGATANDPSPASVGISADEKE